jgi:hypothetical protein
MKFLCVLRNYQPKLDKPEKIKSKVKNQRAKVKGQKSKGKNQRAKVKGQKPKGKVKGQKPKGKVKTIDASMEK